MLKIQDKVVIQHKDGIEIQYLYGTITSVGTNDSGKSIYAIDEQGLKDSKWHDSEVVFKLEKPNF